MTWRKIDSAPKDGTHVLLYFGPPAAGGFVIAAWRRPFEQSDVEAEWMDGARKVMAVPWVVAPTHWMPLPLPPPPEDAPE